MPPARKSAEADEALSRQGLKSAIWYTVTKIAQEEEISLPFAASEHFVASLAEVVFQQAQSLGKDLERFAKHAGRMTINVDDVKLAARRNEPLYDQLCTAATQHGLALADLKADQSKPKKAPRASSTTKTAVASTSKAAPAAKSKAAKGKGKGTAKESDVEEEEEEDEAPPGGFVAASSLKGRMKAAKSVAASSTKSSSKSTSKSKGKSKAVEPDEDDDELLDLDDGFDGVDVEAQSEDPVEEDSSEEEMGKKRKGKKAAGGGKAKKRRAVEDSD
ncbi:hypothetical protein JCM8097_000798 [Rhodosporidiobolus ruineniae]